jgi:hypothetical protein
VRTGCIAAELTWVGRAEDGAKHSVRRPDEGAVAVQRCGLVQRGFIVPRAQVVINIRYDKCMTAIDTATAASPNNPSSTYAMSNCLPKRPSALVLMTVQTSRQPSAVRWRNHTPESCWRWSVIEGA